MQQDLRRYLRQVRNGRSLLILDADRPVAELKPFEQVSASEDEMPGDLEAQIDLLYGEIRDLVARSVEEPAAETQVEQKREQLRSLQSREAELMDARAAARLRVLIRAKENGS